MLRGLRPTAVYWHPQMLLYVGGGTLAVVGIVVVLYKMS